MSNFARISLRPLSDGPAVGFPLNTESPAAPVISDPTLAQWLRHWLTHMVAPSRAATTVYCYSNIVEKHLVPALGKVRLRELDHKLINSYYQWLAAEKGLSPNTIRKHHILLHTSLQYAFQQGVVPDNPIRRVVPPSPVPGNARYYTPQQLNRLLSIVTGHPLELPVKLACHLGLRRSEILGLQWRDVDLQAGIIAIRRVRTSMGNQVVEKQPKTADSCRTLSIAALENLLGLLQQIYIRRKPAAEDWVVLDCRGKPWHPNSMSTTFSHYVTAHGLPSITLHGLRHTFASVASSARVPMYEISRALGHSNPATTQRIYTHLFDLTHGDVLAAVAAAISAEDETA